jgi:hypothetical protein
MARAPKHAFACWPATDQALWRQATTKGESLLDRGPYAHWSDETHRQAYCAYTRWLDYLAQHDRRALAQSPERRLTEARVKAFLAEIAKHVTALSMASTINHFINALHAIAPSYDTGWLRREQHSFQRRAKPRPKRERMVEHAKLYELGLSLMDGAKPMSDRDQAARTFRDGLIIAVLISIPALRRKNLSELTVNRHLQRVGHRFHVVVEADETKCKQQAIDRPLSARLTPYIEAYLADYRLRFRGAESHDGLWPSMRGRSLSPEQIGLAVGQRTLEAFGHKINLHLFRDIAVTGLSNDDAADLSAASQLLSHRSQIITETHYRQPDSLEASRWFGGVISAQRGDIAAHAQEVGDVLPGSRRSTKPRRYITKTNA